MNEKLAQFHSCRVNFLGAPRYTTYEVSYKVNVGDVIIEPMADFFTMKGFFMCNGNAICLN
jgi:hypothetical protein